MNFILSTSYITALILTKIAKNASFKPLKRFFLSQRVVAEFNKILLFSEKKLKTDIIIVLDKKLKNTLTNDFA